MLVNWTFGGVKVIQVPATNEMVVLAPGYNQVDDLTWKLCRDLVLCQIANGDIVEEWQTVEKNGAQHKAAILSVPCEDEKLQVTSVRIPIVFKELTRKRLPAVIKETLNPALIVEWYKAENRDDICTALKRHMEEDLKEDIFRRMGIDTPKTKEQ
jgi:hypothetical protein